MRTETCGRRLEGKLFHSRRGWQSVRVVGDQSSVGHQRQSDRPAVYQRSGGLTRDRLLCTGPGDGPHDGEMRRARKGDESQGLERFRFGTTDRRRLPSTRKTPSATRQSIHKTLRSEVGEERSRNRPAHRSATRLDLHDAITLGRELESFSNRSSQDPLRHSEKLGHNARWRSHCTSKSPRRQCTASG